MPPRLTHPDLVKAYEALRASGPRGRELAEVLDRYNTKVVFAKWVVGGFTLNFINRIFLQPLRPDYTQDEFKYLVTLLAHEACHVQQRFVVDSIEQEVRSYLAQCAVAEELGINIGLIQQTFGRLDPDLQEDLQRAAIELVNLFAGQPASIVYAALPVLQPRGFRPTTRAAVRQIAAVVRAGLKNPAR